MGLFSRAPARPQWGDRNQFSVRHSETQPRWMHEGRLEVALLGGNITLEVVGESHHQDALWRLAGGRGQPEDYVRTQIYALLLAEVDNPYDPDAISVWIDGLRVGYLSRVDAERYRPGLLALQEQYGKPVALAGVIAGGGIREDGPGRLGVFLSHDPEDFGLRHPRVVPVHAAMRTGRSAVIDADDDDESYSTAWLRDLPADDARAIPVLRRLLAAETDALHRHFIFAELEAALYRCRDVFASALDEYDTACRRHDAEMDSIRAACLAKWGKVPLLELYRQMAIRQQKAQNYQQALWWAERGLAIYAGDAARPEAVDELRQRAASYRLKLGR